LVLGCEPWIVTTSQRLRPNLELWHDLCYHARLPTQTPILRKEEAVKITERDDEGVTVFTLEGRIDTSGAQTMDQALQAAVKQGKSWMVLDMAQSDYICSAGLRTLADVLTKNRAQDGDLKLAAVPSRVMSILQVIGFDNFFSFYDSVKDAVAAY
jgi:anti-anti-sigma factor